MWSGSLSSIFWSCGIARLLVKSVHPGKRTTESFGDGLTSRIAEQWAVLAVHPVAQRRGGDAGLLGEPGQREVPLQHLLLEPEDEQPPQVVLGVAGADPAPLANEHTGHHGARSSPSSLSGQRTKSGNVCR